MAIGALVMEISAKNPQKATKRGFLLLGDWESAAARKGVSRIHYLVYFQVYAKFEHLQIIFGRFMGKKLELMAGGEEEHIPKMLFLGHLAAYSLWVFFCLLRMLGESLDQLLGSGTFVSGL